MPNQDLQNATLLLAQGNMPQAEAYLRNHIAMQGHTAESGALLRVLEEKYELPPGFRLSEKNPQRRAADQRFLVIKAWGYGFWSEAHHLASQLLLAELTQRTPVVHWGSNSLFRAHDSDNSFCEFFQPVSTVEISDIPRSESLYPPKWNWGNITEENINKWDGKYSRMSVQHLFNRPEDVLVSDFFSTLDCITPWIGSDSKFFGQSTEALYAQLFQRYLVPSTDVAKVADAFYSMHMAGRHWIAVHMRGSDKIHESPDLHRINKDYYAYIDRIIELNPDIGIFLLTDYAPILEEFKLRYPQRLLSTQATRSSNEVGIHLSGHEGIAIGREVLLDVLLALRCGYFIGNQESNVSLAIQSMGKWSPGYLFMLGSKSVRESNLFLHTRPEPTAPKCRLCNAQTTFAFSQNVLGKHAVDYFKCQGCGSLQTEQPFWLDEAYSGDPERFDTGKASRTLSNFLILPRLLEILGTTKADHCVDFGGGTGLFSRLMRDIGFNYFTYDKYASSEFCTAFRWPAFDRPTKLITIFECAEHFSNPALEWERLLSGKPDIVIGTTGLYGDQKSDWGYLSPESGQHIFFYSSQALGLIASKHGMSAYIVGGYFLFTKFPLSQSTLDGIQEWSTSLGKVCHDTFNAWASNPYSVASRDNAKVTARTVQEIHPQRVILDGVFFRFNTGISRLWKSLLAEWSVNGFAEYLVVIDRGSTAPRFPGIRYVSAPHRDYTNRAADRQMLQEICDQEKATLFISTYYTTPTRTPSVMLVPDMIPEIMGFDLSSEQWVEKHEAIRFSSHYLAISHSTARDVRRFFPEIAHREVVVAHCGSDFRTPSKEKVASFQSRYGVNRPYFMISGVKSGYKNALLFFKAFAELGERRGEYAIMCTNSGPTLEQEFAECVGDASLHLLILSDEDLQAAYAGAIALAYPSRYEGFGLPVLEAMACSCPVITCNNSSISEVAGDAALYVDADKTQEMLSALQAVQRPDIRNDLIARGQQQAKGFSWRKMADDVESALLRWAKQPTSTPASS